MKRRVALTFGWVFSDGVFGSVQRRDTNLLPGGSWRGGKWANLHRNVGRHRNSENRPIEVQIHAVFPDIFCALVCLSSVVHELFLGVPLSRTLGSTGGYLTQPAVECQLFSQ